MTTEAWPWQCWLCGAKGTTTSPDPFTLHNQTFRHKLYAVAKLKWGARFFSSMSNSRRG